MARLTVDSAVSGRCLLGLWWVGKSEDGKSITLMDDPLFSFTGVSLSTLFEASIVSSVELLDIRKHFLSPTIFTTKSAADH